MFRNCFVSKFASKHCQGRVDDAALRDAERMRPMFASRHTQRKHAAIALARASAATSLSSASSSSTTSSVNAIEPLRRARLQQATSVLVTRQCDALLAAAVGVVADRHRTIGVDERALLLHLCAGDDGYMLKKCVDNLRNYNYC